MRLLLADDHTLFRDTLRQYIERSNPESKITLTKDLPETIKALEEDREHDLILLDLRMPGMNGLEGLREVKNKFNIPVALMSGVAEHEDVRAAMELGAIGYFPKTLSGKALLQAIKLVMTGEKFIPIERNSSKVMPSYFADESASSGAYPVSQDSEIDNSDIKLTPREKDVLSFLVKGSPNKEIANALELQVVTVKLHVRGICRKLGAQNRTQAALIAKERGLAS